ncbi:uncharacterized protein LOC114330889 [Diabrotica virgifera virgifera]|uniref:Uncharacterized protein LOC114330889 n=1 Tax=Diabrotica virgifera virgifera TaxID=50390 RepID=A0A6P7FJ43_DIAVI|nr:uncharacterized protein LOC114330889 [Diabrotica virgifera virgifera]
MQCGRCNHDNEQSNHKSEAVESQYGKIAENSLFKCINRFDGCRELLKYSEVQDHEQVCLKKIHRCPICYEEMASLLLLPHFHSNHKDAILDCPAFIFKLNNHLETPNAYTYQEGDNLFFLYVNYRKSENTIKLDLVYMGNLEHAKNIYHQFSLSSENKEFDIVLDPTPCTQDIVVVDISHMSNFVQIKFKLIDRNLKVLMSTEISNAGVVKKPVLNPVLNNALHGSQIVKKQSELSQRCVKCQEYYIFSLSTYSISYYYKDKRSNNCICYYCYQWFKSDGYIRRIIPKKIATDMWNCSNCRSNIQASDMQFHEINCKQGKKFSCPIKNCREKGTVNEITEHLKVHNCLAFSSHFKLTSDSLRCYVFVKKYIVFLHLTRVESTFNVKYNIQVKIVTKTDNNENSTTLKPRVMFFDSRNQLLNGYSMGTSTGEIFIKVIINN